MDELRAILEARERFYSRAEASLDTSGKTLDASVYELAELIGRLSPQTR